MVDGSSCSIGRRGRPWRREILQIFDAGQPLVPPRALATNIVGPEGMAFLPSGHLAVIETGTRNVIAIDPGTGETSVVAEAISPAFTLLDAVPAWGINGIAVGPSGNVYVTSPGDGRLYRIGFEHADTHGG